MVKRLYDIIALVLIGKNLATKGILDAVPRQFLAASRKLLGRIACYLRQRICSTLVLIEPQTGQPNPSVVVLPGSVEEVQSIVWLANEYSLALVPSGGRTGLSGGAVAKDGEIVVVMDRLNKLFDFNSTDRTVTVGAGMVTEALQKIAANEDLFYPVDFASSGSSQIGGNIATNAGGINVIRYGMTREWVVGLKVVTGAGDILEFQSWLDKKQYRL